MNKSESIAALAAALSKAQGQIEGAVKDSENPFFKSKYADLASVTAAIRAPFSSNGISYTQIVHPAESGVAIETILMHSSGEWLSGGVVAVPVAKHDAQGYGSAITYARRYSLSAIAGVSAEDDDGNAASKVVEKKPSGAQPNSVGKELWNNAAPEEKEFLEGELKAINELLGKGENDAATERFYKIADQEEQLAVWSQIPSDARRIIKDAKAAMEKRKAAHKSKPDIPALYQEALSLAKAKNDLCLDLCRDLPADMAAEIKSVFEQYEGQK